MQNHQEAFNFYVKALKYDDKDIHSLIGAGRTTMKLNRYSDAATFLQKAYALMVLTEVDKAKGIKLTKEQEKEIVTILMDIHFCYFETGDLDNSKMYLEKARDLEPESYDVNFGLGNICFEAKSYKSSIDYYLKALEID